MNPKYTVYGTPKCSWCDKAKGLLDSQGFSYTYVDVSEDAEGLKKLKDLGLATVPQVWEENQHIGGYSELAQGLGV